MAAIAAVCVAGALAWLVAGIVVWGPSLDGPSWWWQVFIVSMFASAGVAAVAAVVNGLAGWQETLPQKVRDD